VGIRVDLLQSGHQSIALGIAAHGSYVGRGVWVCLVNV
jgi:hypothetical protein